MTQALIGTGLMGFPIAEKILKSNYELYVYNRTIEKAEPLIPLGAKILKSAKSAINSSDRIIIMLSDYQAIQNTIFPNNSKLDLTNKTIIQMSTISPSESILLGNKVNNYGGDYIEAPVLGSIPEVQSGQLIIMVSTKPKLFNKHLDILKCLGSQTFLLGDIGKASALKLAMNQLIASLTSAFSLSLAFIKEHHIDTDLFMNVLRNSALYAPTFDKKLKRILSNDFSNPNFPTKHLEKDVKLFIKESTSLKLNTESINGVLRIIENTIKANHTNDDYSSIYNAIIPKPNSNQQLNNI